MKSSGIMFIVPIFAATLLICALALYHKGQLKQKERRHQERLELQARFYQKRHHQEQFHCECLKQFARGGEKHGKN